jgi:large subunit ribosomal protein L11
MSKIVERTLRLMAYAGSSKPTAKLGQALGPLGLNMAQFCKDFNDKTGHIREDTPLRVVLTAYKDKTYKFDVLSPPTAWMIKKACGISKGSGSAGKEKVGVLSAKAIYEIAKVKKGMDAKLNKVSHESMCAMIAGQCRSMGIHVSADYPKPAARRVYHRKVGVK